MGAMTLSITTQGKGESDRHGKADTRKHCNGRGMLHAEHPLRGNERDIRHAHPCPLSKDDCNDRV